MNTKQLTAHRDWLSEVIEQQQPISGYDFTSQVPHITTEQMLAVLTLADTGQFTLAAEKLGMSQPGLSRQIQRIEKATRRTIFMRSSNGATLTPQGAQVVIWCRDTLASLERLGG